MTGAKGLRFLVTGLLPALLVGCAGDPPARPGARDLAELEPAQLMRLGNQFRQAGELTTAMRFYSQAADRTPDAAEPLVAIGDLQLSTGRIEAARQAFERALDRAPGHAPALSGLARAEIAADRPQAALDALADLDLSTGTDPRPHNARGVALDLLGHHSEARASYALALEAAPEDPDVLSNLALSLAVGGDHAAALEILRDLEAGTPENRALVRENMALVVAMTGRPDDAVSLAATVLPQSTAVSNRPFYDRLDELEGRDLARAVFRGKLPEPQGLAAAEESTPTAPNDVPPPKKNSASESPAAPERTADVEMSDDDAAPAETVLADPPETMSQVNAPERSDADPTSQTMPAETPDAISTVEEEESEAARSPSAETATGYHLQLGAFQDREGLFRQWDMAKEHDAFDGIAPLEMAVTDDEGTMMHRLLVGPVEGYAAATQICEAVAEVLDCVVLPLQPEAKPLTMETDEKG